MRRFNALAILMGLLVFAVFAVAGAAQAPRLPRPRILRGDRS